MATESRHDEPPAGLDLDSSPFESQGIEGLPLTKEQRAIVREVIEEYEQQRAAAAKTA
jgi:hypothetical protein